MVHVQPVRATIPRRREVRARVGVLEDVLGAAGDGLGSELGDECLGTVYPNHHEDALSVQEAELAMMRRVGAQNTTFSSRRTILRSRMKAWTDEEA